MRSSLLKVIGYDCHATLHWTKWYHTKKYLYWYYMYLLLICFHVYTQETRVFLHLKVVMCNVVVWFWQVYLLPWLQTMYRSFRTNAKSEGSVWNHQSIKQFNKTLQECEWRFEIDGLPTIIPIKDCGVFVKERCSIISHCSVKQWWIKWFQAYNTAIRYLLSNWHVSLGLFFFSDTFIFNTEIYNRLQIALHWTSSNHPRGKF